MVLAASAAQAATIKTLWKKLFIHNEALSICGGTVMIGL